MKQEEHENGAPDRQVLREAPSPDAVRGDGSRSNLKTRVFDAGILVLCLTIFVIKAASSLVQESSTWDETSYFGLGKYLLQHHRWDVSASILHPPLSYYIHSVPLLFFPTDENIWKNDPVRADDPEYLGATDVSRGWALLSSTANRGDRLLHLARLMMVATAVLLGIYVYLWSYALYGRLSALLAAVLFSFSPNILAHARLITPDIALTTFSFITLYYFWRLLKLERVRDAVLGGICLGLALLSKFNGVLLFPICFALMILWRERQRRLNQRHCLIFALVGIGILFVGYAGNLGPYFAGIAFQYSHAATGHPAFLLGHYSEKGWWHYFIVAFLIKTPIATLLFLALATVLLAGSWRKEGWMNESFLVLPAGAIFCFFSISRCDIGLRYILAVYPFLFVFASRVAQICFTTRLRMGLYLLAIAWYIGASCYIHPHYLAYFNELVGGPDNGYKYLVDSNLDWGQDLKGLKQFMDKNAISTINLSYFGSDSPERYGITYNWMPSFVLNDPHPEKHYQVVKGWVAISATTLQGDYLENKDQFAWFRSRQPVAKIGYSIFIYKIEE